MNIDTTQAREAILGRLREARRPWSPLPEVKRYAVPGDPVQNFERKLQEADGRLQRCASRREALAWLSGQIARNGKVVFSAVDDFPGTIALNELSDPHAANVVDVCVADGVMGVGETGSVWVTDESLGLTAAALFCTDLYLLLDSRMIVDGIAEAYSRIDLRGHRYGAFFTGPSATADIEAVHITGAQGEISLTVLLY